MNALVKQVPVPSMKSKDIVPPDLEYDYFVHASRHPFDFNAETYTPLNAWWMAEASLLAYCPPRFEQYALGYRTDLKKFKFFQGNTTECFAASNDDFAIVAFRGTEVVSMNAIADVFSDLQFNLVPFQGSSTHKVHMGFRDALYETWDKPDGLKAYLDYLRSENPKIKLWFTGHSLGGAMATLAAAAYKEVHGLYTFGSPMVGNYPFVNDFPVRTWRFFHNYDLVVYLPPNAPTKKEELLYTHVGEPYFISAEGDVNFFDANQLENAPIPTNLKGYFKDRIKKVFKSIDKLDLSILKNSASETADHAPIFYTVKLWNYYISQL